MQGGEGAESIPAGKGLICTNSPPGMERNPLLQTAFAKTSPISCALQTFTAASWVPFSVAVVEIQGGVDLFSVLRAKLCLVFLPCSISRWVFVHLAGSVPTTGPFSSPCPSRVASPELLVFMSVNRFPKLPSQNI